MAFPSSAGATVSLSDIWRQVRSVAAQVKGTSVSLRTSSEATSISAFSILQYVDELRQHRARFQQAAGVVGLLEYARAQINDPTLDLVAEFNSMTTQIDATIAWVFANLPANAGFTQVVTLNADGSNTWRTFSSAATSGLRTQLDALIATIN